MREIYGHIDRDENLKEYVPSDPKERARLPKQWVVNILSVLTGGDFDKWVLSKINDRNQARAIKADKLVDLDPEIAEIFNNSTAISLTKGSAHSMLQV